MAQTFAALQTARVLRTSSESYPRTVQRSSYPEASLTLRVSVLTCPKNTNPKRKRGLLHGIELNLVDITPAPVLPRLGGLHDGVAARVEMLRGVLILGGVAAADMAARQTEPEVHPPFPGCQALFAALRVGRDRPDFLDVRTGVRGHGGSPTGGGRIALGRYDRISHSSASGRRWTGGRSRPCLGIPL